MQPRRGDNACLHRSRRPIVVSREGVRERAFVTRQAVVARAARLKRIIVVIIGGRIGSVF